MNDLPVLFSTHKPLVIDLSPLSSWGVAVIEQFARHLMSSQDKPITETHFQSSVKIFSLQKWYSLAKVTEGSKAPTDFQKKLNQFINGLMWSYAYKHKKGSVTEIASNPWLYLPCCLIATYQSDFRLPLLSIYLSA